MDVRVGPWRGLNTEKLTLLNCGAREDSWESLGQQQIQSVPPKGNQSWIFIGRTDAETEAPMLWPPNAESRFIRKDPDDGKDWRQEEKRTTEDEMVGWCHWLLGHEFEQALGDGEGQRRLACCSPWSQRIGHNNGFSSSHVQMWELEHKKCWVPNNWCFQIMALEESLESPLDNKEIKLVNLNGNQPWIFFGRTMAKADLQ